MPFNHPEKRSGDILGQPLLGLLKIFQSNSALLKDWNKFYIHIKMVADLFLLLILLLSPSQSSLKTPRAFDHPLHRPKSVNYNPGTKPDKKLLARPFDHPDHTALINESLNKTAHRDFTVQEVFSQASLPLPGHPPEVGNIKLRHKKHIPRKRLNTTGSPQPKLISRSSSIGRTRTSAPRT